MSYLIERALHSQHSVFPPIVDSMTMMQPWPPHPYIVFFATFCLAIQLAASDKSSHQCFNAPMQLRSICVPMCLDVLAFFAGFCLAAIQAAGSDKPPVYQALHLEPPLFPRLLLSRQRGTAGKNQGFVRACFAICQASLLKGYLCPNYCISS